MIRWSHRNNEAHPKDLSLGRALFFGILVGVGAIVVSGVVVWFQQVLADDYGILFLKKTIGERVANDEMRGMELVRCVIWICLLSPLWEEFFFRGILQGWILERCPKMVAAILVSLLFAGVHWDIVSFLPLFCVSFCFSLVFNRTGCLVSPMIAHMIYNAFLLWWRVCAV